MSANVSPEAYITKIKCACSVYLLRIEEGIDDGDSWFPDLTKEYLSHRGAVQAGGGGAGGGGGKNFQPSKNLMMRYSNRIHLDRYDGPRVSHAVRNQISEAARRDDSARCVRRRDGGGRDEEERE